ncbi:MAG: sprT domain-containing protein [Bacteroidetes bacterium MedPE-SWsnd-G2]|nr:MAG: sprT domain-containing protein [Bacteroidetes bacterium MedPE-SWsnd-G2]
MTNNLSQFIPENAIVYVSNLLEHDKLVLKPKSERKTRHGDFREMPNGEFQITVNTNLNQYRFLITLVHEIAHFEAYLKFGKQIKPHGKEWKFTFKTLMLPLLNPEVFPVDLLPVLAKHFLNPKASSDSDHKLAFALKQFDPPNGKTYIFEVPLGAHFKLHNKRVFKMGAKRVKRFEAQEVSTGKLYLFNPNAEVELLEK